MFYIKNPRGRIIDIDDYNEYLEWVKTDGFIVPSDDEIAQYIQEKSKRFEMMRSREKNADEYDNGLYFLTVPPGGADGYSTTAQSIFYHLNTLGIYTVGQFKGQRIGLVYHHPYSITSIETDYRILYTMFESDKLPDDWREYLELCDLILVPSKWVASLFEKFGFTAQVVPLGYDDDRFQYIERQTAESQKRPFMFLHYNAFNLRKGHFEIFNAFVQEFSPDEPVRLILKTTLNDPPIPILPSEYPNIDVVTGKLSDDDMVSLMEKSDCFVFPSRGEGFGVPPLEAMATGLPAIVPNAHGITEYFNDQYMYEVKTGSTCPGIYQRYRGVDVGNMVVCDIPHLRAQMRYIYTHQDAAIAVGKKASEYVKNWTMRKTAEGIRDVFDKAVRSPIRERAVKDTIVLEKVK